MAISMKSKIIRRNELESAQVDDEMAMADIDTGKYYGLNDIATAIWNNLETKITVEELCKRLCEDYEVAAEQCSDDVLFFLRELKTRNLILTEE